MCGAFFALLFSNGIIGGTLGSKFSHYYCALLGNITMIVGLLSFILPVPVELSLGLFTVGVGFWTPNFMLLTGQMYEAKDAKRFNAYLIVYACMNLGIMLGSFGSTYLVTKIGYTNSIGFAGLFTMLAGVLYHAIYKRLPFITSSHCREQLTQHLPHKAIVIIPLWLAMIFVNALLILHHDACFTVVIALFALALGWLLLQAIRHYRLKRESALFLFIALSLVGIVFWSLFNILPSALALFINDYVNRVMFGHTIAASTFMGINGAFIVLIALSYMALTIHYPLKVSSRIGVGAGTMVMGLGYAALWLAVMINPSMINIGIGWIILSYFLQSLGEMGLGPLSWSMVGEFGPTPLQGFMMGYSQLITGVSGVFAAFLAKVMVSTGSVEPTAIAHHFTTVFGIFALVALGFGLLPFLIKMTPKAPWWQFFSDLKNKLKNRLHP